MKKNRNYYIRRTHRYLGVIIGIQFLLWTVGGLYFSWNNIDDVHGDHLRKSVPLFSTDVKMVSPSVAIQFLKEETPVDSIKGIRLISILGKPVYQIQYMFGPHVEGSDHSGHFQFALADAQTGKVRNELTKDEAIEIAKENIISGATIKTVERLEEVGNHSEYRERPLPAYAITFVEPVCTVYISTELGTFQTIRHDQWRIFDFLWMLHTMDYETRDNFGNIALRAFSIFGLFTVCSGFLLFFVSSSWFNRKNKAPKIEVGIDKNEV